MGPYLTVGVLMLAGWAALNPWPMAWVYIVVVLGFEAWLLWRMRSVGNAPVPAGAAPYDFSGEEARLVGRYRFYFVHPGIAKQASSVLAAIGLSTIGLALWLTYKLAFAPAIIVGLNIFPVAWFTRRVAPMMALTMSAARGNRDAMRMLEVHDPAWTKIRAANSSTIDAKE
jgi:hypothetical protein